MIPAPLLTGSATHGYNGVCNDLYMRFKFGEKGKRLTDNPEKV